MKQGIKIEGFSRVRILENGEIKGDSGWCGPNQITNLGFMNYLCQLLGKEAASKQIGFIALGTGGVPASNAVVLAGEIMASTQRKAVTAGSVASTTEQFTATFASADSFLTGASNLSNIGLFAATTTNDTLFAGNEYTSSSCNTNQDVNVTLNRKKGHLSVMARSKLLKFRETLDNFKTILSQAFIWEGETTRGVAPALVG